MVDYLVEIYGISGYSKLITILLLSRLLFFHLCREIDEGGEKQRKPNLTWFSSPLETKQMLDGFEEEACGSL